MNLKIKPLIVFPVPNSANSSYNTPRRSEDIDPYGSMDFHDSNVRKSTGEACSNTTPVQSLWKFGLNEIIFGARGIPKMSHLWLPLALLLSSVPTTGLKTAFNSSLPLILAVFCKVQFSILINDLGDRRADLAAGKKRWITFLPERLGDIIVILFLAGGVIAVFLGRGSLPTILAYAASVLFGLSYSVRPLRFKERGILGLLIYALSALCIYVMVPWTWFNARLWQLIFLTAAVGSDKWIQIHFHQVVDYHADLKSGTRTYAVQAGLQRARSALKTAAFIATFCLLSATVYVIVLARDRGIRVVLLVLAAATIIASKVYTHRSKNPKSDSSSALTRELPWIYLGLTYLVFFALPPVLFLFFALKEPWIWALVAFSVFSAAGTSWQSLRYQDNRGKGLG